MKKENARRSKMLHFAVTEEEARIIDAKMKQLEIHNISAFLRAMVLNGYVLKLDLPQLREMIRLLGNLTNNVNQIARRVNEHGSIYESEIDEIQEKVNRLLGMMNQLLSTLQLNTVWGQSRILCKLQNVVQIEQNLCKTGAAQAAAALFIK